MIFADIIIDISSEKLDRSFQYRVPEELEKEIKVGMVVSIPFGNGNQLRKGYVTGLTREPKVDPARLKNICGISSAEETTESRLIALAAWMRENYGSTMIQALKTVLPIQEKMKAKEKRYLCLKISREEAEKLLEELEKTRFKARTRLLRELLKKPRLDVSYASKELGATTSVVKKMTEQGIISIEYEELLRNSLDTEKLRLEEELPLTPEQETAVREILREWEKETPRPVLIEGVTGSGKTQVYMKLIETVLDQGQQAIILIPEIALTYQTVRRFYARFGEKVSVINSRQSQGERYDQFKRARRGEVQVMVGPRSALFTPFANLGLIVIDEEHESSYKSENSPRYHARETAVERARLEHARVVLGSATPSLEVYHKAMEGTYGLVKLQSRYQDRPMPLVSVVDLREELKAGNRSVLSRKLKEAMKDRLEKREQIILFLNRRGYAGFVSCRSCGQVMKCPHCDVSLSEHNNGRLLCHYCGYETVKPQACPVCGSPYIGGFKAGTQQIEKVVKEAFPGVRTLRMDFDTTRTKGSYEKILSAFASHEADVLIGTQMIVKGHDFPDVTLVGIVAADLSLNAEDYRCSERTFQLLCQAVGRGGRGNKPGEAVIQTYHPDHYSIQAAAVQDYEAFYQEEMSYRMLLDYPPASHMMAVRIKDQLEKYIEINSGFRKLYIQFDFS